jgi:Tat protein secretion system quality control protein TatD with DNase activity
MYRLLGNLVLYINCISDKDLRDDQAAAMNRLVVHLEGGGGTVGIGSMGLDAKAMETVAAWKKDVENAFKNQSAAADAARKPAYVRQLRTLFEAF